ncbi:hypothetical protein LJR016_002281 [Devosia sp. LjRoot16]|uniref:hypothetical protein n=1 Tax=Devosia sp. LjRoot16 TaxID=3342271 RepID=UPI003ECD414C
MSNATTSTVAATPIMSHRDFRRTRHIKRNVRLHDQIRDLITANAACRYIGGNSAVEAIAARLGFQPHDLAIADVRVGRRIVTLICVPHRIWDRAFPSAKAIDLRFQARESGHAAILVPQSVIEREPRLGNSQLLARTATIKVDATSRMMILAHLIENGASCLSELAGLIQHPDPIGAILHLVTIGVVAIDLGQCITPYTMADIAAPQTGSRH